MTHWRVVLHALDRTGPPTLGAAWLRWLSSTGAHTADVVAVRGGPMRAELESLSCVTDVRVLLDPTDPPIVDADVPAPARVRVGGLPPAEATLLLSVAAAQALPVLPPTPTVTWSVEAGEDLHWVERPLGLAARTTRWCAGSRTTLEDLRTLLPGVPIGLLPEFVDDPGPAPSALVAARRATLTAGAPTVTVVGAGIATYRKAPDLFLEVLVAHRRRHGDACRATWIGGEDDPLHRLVRAEARRVAGGAVSFVPSVPDLPAWLAAADVFLHTARLDSFPLVCLQAALAGTPVLSFSGTGGVEEMFGDAHAGAPFPDVGGLADRLERLRSDPAARDEVAAAQRERVRSAFVTDVAAPAVLDELATAADLATSTGRTP